MKACFFISLICLNDVYDCQNKLCKYRIIIKETQVNKQIKANVCQVKRQLYEEEGEYSGRTRFWIYRKKENVKDTKERDAWY